MFFIMATQKGLEPSTFGVTGRRSNRLSYDPAFSKLKSFWWAKQGSNL